MYTGAFFLTIDEVKREASKQNSIDPESHICQLSAVAVADISAPG